MGALVTSAEHHESSFVSLRSAGARLTPYATAYRYPADEFQPDREEYENAERDAAALLAHVVRLLSPDVNPF